MAHLDGCVKSRLHRESIRGPSSLYRMAIPTELSRPPTRNLKIRQDRCLAFVIVIFTTFLPFGGIVKCNGPVSHIPVITAFPDHLVPDVVVLPCVGNSCMSYVTYGVCAVL